MNSAKKLLTVLGKSDTRQTLYISDGFSIYPTTDGNGIPSVGWKGGAGRTWAGRGYGTWGTTSETMLCSALVGGTGVNTINTSSPNVKVGVRVSTYAGGWAGVATRYVTNGNFIAAYWDGSRIRAFKLVNTTNTALITSGLGLSFGANSLIEIEINKTQVSVYLDGTQVGETQTVEDIQLLDSPFHGVITSNVGNAFDNFNVYPFGDSWVNYLAIGDSKTLGSGDNPANLGFSSKISITTQQFVECPLRVAAGGRTVALQATGINTDLAAALGTPDHILINLGANDSASIPVETTFKANYATIITALHSKYPSAPIYLARPVLLSDVPASTPTADNATVRGWIDEIIALYDYVYAGIDETALEGGDGYATNFVDTTHQTAAGYLAVAGLWKTAMGY